MSTLKTTFLLEDKFTSRLNRIIQQTEKFNKLLENKNFTKALTISGNTTSAEIDKLNDKLTKLNKKSSKVKKSLESVFSQKNYTVNDFLLPQNPFLNPNQTIPFLNPQLTNPSPLLQKENSEENPKLKKPFMKIPSFDFSKFLEGFSKLKNDLALKFNNLTSNIHFKHLDQLRLNLTSKVNALTNNIHFKYLDNLRINLTNKVNALTNNIYFKHLDSLRVNLTNKVNTLTSKIHFKGLDKVKNQLSVKIKSLTSNIHLKALDKLKINLTSKLNHLTSKIDLNGFNKLKTQLSSKISQLSSNLHEKFKMPSFQSQSNDIMSVVKSISALGVAIIGLKKAFSTMLEGVKLNNTQNSQLLSMQSVYGDDLGKNVYQYVSERAKTSALGREDIALAVSQSAPFITDSKQLEKYVSLLERLYAKDPTQGEGSAFALKELMSGDVMSARSRYGLNFSGEKLRSLDGMEKLDYIEEVFNKYGITSKLVDKQAETLGVKWNIFTSNLKTKFGEASSVIADKLQGIVDKFNQMLDNGKLDVFINAFINGFNMILDGVVNLINFFNQLFIVVKNNAFIQGLLFTTIAIGAVMGAGALLKMVGVFSLLIAKATILMVRLMMAHLPLTLLIGGFLLLASIFNDGTNSFIQGAINVIMSWVRVFNALWILLQMLWNFLVDLTEGVVNLFLKMRNGLVDVLSGLATACLSALKPLTIMLDNIFGSNLTNSLNNFKSKTKTAIDGLKTEMANFDKTKVVYKDFSTPLENKMKDMFGLNNKKTNLEQTINTPNIDLSGFDNLTNTVEDIKTDGLGVQNVGNSSLDVSIDKEDLKYIRDIAERDVIKKVSENTLNPIINVSFGDIHETADVYKIKKVVEKALMDELAVISNL